MPGASILPVALHKGKLYFLLGKENPMETYEKGFSDFGGGIEKGESTLEAALREGSEELSGFLGTTQNIKSHIKKHGGTYKLAIPIYNNPKSVYTVHIIHHDFDPLLPMYYNKNHQFLWNRMNKKTLNDSKLFEKIEIEWFCEDDLQKRMREYRPFYRDVIKNIIQELPHIKHFIKRCNKKCRKTSKRRVSTGTRKIVGGR